MKSDKLYLSTDGWYDIGDDYYDSGYACLQLWQLTNNNEYTLAWESLYHDADSMSYHQEIKEEFMTVMHKFGLTPDDIVDFDSNCIFDWEIK